MSINLISRFGRERARGSLESSFAQFQADRAVVGLVRQIRKNESLVAELQDSAQCHLGDFAEYAKVRINIKELEKLLSKRDGRRTFQSRDRTKRCDRADPGLHLHPRARSSSRCSRLGKNPDGQLARKNPRRWLQTDPVHA